MPHTSLLVVSLLAALSHNSHNRLVPYHNILFESSGNYSVLNGKFSALKIQGFLKSSHVMQNIYIKIFTFKLWIETMMIPIIVNC